MKQEWLFAVTGGGWALFGPVGPTPLQAGARMIRDPVRVDILLVPGPPGVDPSHPSVGTLTNVTALPLPWAWVQETDILWSGDPEVNPRLAPLYRMYHNATRATLSPFPSRA